ncbi:MAG: ankyrin repeat domain-containing protein, partial [Mesorhizobium sp.]
YRNVIEEAEIAGFEAGASLLRDAMAGRNSDRQ